MISQRLVDMIESHADELTRSWLREVQRHEATLYKRAYDV